MKLFSDDLTENVSFGHPPATVQVSNGGDRRARENEGGRKDLGSQQGQDILLFLCWGACTCVTRSCLLIL